MKLRTSNSLHSDSFASGSSLNPLIARLKRSVARRLTDQYARLMPVALIRRALDDAEELARDTAFPHLFFPALAEEKVRIVSAFLSRDAAPRARHELQTAA